MIRNPQSLEDKYAQLAFDTAFRCKENNSNCQKPASDGGAADHPVSSFRTTFAYTNITHTLAGRIVAKKAGQPVWNAVLPRELLGPRGMTDSSYTADAIKAAVNRAEGYRWTPTGTIEVPFMQFPYIIGAAGDINSTVEDLACWVRRRLYGPARTGRLVRRSRGEFGPTADGFRPVSDRQGGQARAAAPVVWRRAGLRIPPRVAAAMLILQARLISRFGSVAKVF
jgi:CubicO group peptidase (beta-lactamase class C family)